MTLDETLRIAAASLEQLPVNEQKRLFEHSLKVITGAVTTSVEALTEVPGVSQADIIAALLYQLSMYKLVAQADRDVKVVADALLEAFGRGLSEGSPFTHVYRRLSVTLDGYLASI